MADCQRAVAFIVNPNSRRGLEVFGEIAAHFHHDDLIYHETTSADHAREMVRHLMHEYDNPVICAVAGDGGQLPIAETTYLEQLATGRTATYMAFPGGNANDHVQVAFPSHRIRHLLRAIERGRTRQLDLIRILAPDGVHHALSYGGFGLSAEGTKDVVEWQAANRALPKDKQLEQTLWRETKIALGSLRRLQPVEIKRGETFSSLNQPHVSFDPSHG